MSAAPLLGADKQVEVTDVRGQCDTARRSGVSFCAPACLKAHQA